VLQAQLAVMRETLGHRRQRVAIESDDDEEDDDI
jgi:hypothetical protein